MTENTDTKIQKLNVIKSARSTYSSEVIEKYTVGQLLDDGGLSTLISLNCVLANVGQLT